MRISLAATKGKILKCWDEGNPYRVEIQNEEKTNFWVPIITMNSSDYPNTIPLIEMM